MTDESKKIKLNEVFGIQSEIPRYTYVDRSGLDERFQYFWGSQRHIVIHGASKQGKTCLRKKNLSPSDTIVIHCQPSMNVNSILSEILRNLGVSLPEQKTVKTASSNAEEVTGNVTGKIPIFIESKVEGKSFDSHSAESVSTSKYADGYYEDIPFISQKIKESGKRLIFEDFHYFDEDVRKDVAYLLKPFFELGIFVLIIGIWAEQNLLYYYNGDLTGRIEEINIAWSPGELNEVLEKGERALNIKFSDEIKQEMIAASFENVGLLQRLAEKICKIENIYEQQDRMKIISNIESLRSAEREIVNEISQRYLKIKDVFERGFRSNTELKVYYQIFHLLTEIDERQLINGIHQAEILRNIQTYSEKTIRPGDLTAALTRIEKLQIEREINPLLVSYNHILRTLVLGDREFLFFRKFSKIKWEWLTDSDISIGDQSIQ